jgi:hypothetical protein
VAVLQEAQEPLFGDLAWLCSGGFLVHDARLQTPRDLRAELPARWRLDNDVVRCKHETFSLALSEMSKDVCRKVVVQPWIPCSKMRTLRIAEVQYQCLRWLNAIDSRRGGAPNTAAPLKSGRGPVGSLYGNAV